MPVSKRQRRWAATASGRKALGAAKAKEWLHTTDAEIAEERKSRKKPTRKSN